MRDNGAGLTPAEQAQLFNRFTRLDHPHTLGHGLGLTIVQRIVTRLGGEVGVDSAPGEGSTFWFTLPIPPSLQAAPWMEDTMPENDKAESRLLDSA